jgi:hypothetical protein
MFVGLAVIFGFERALIVNKSGSDNAPIAIRSFGHCLQVIVSCFRDVAGLAGPLYCTSSGAGVPGDL